MTKRNDKRNAAGPGRKRSQAGAIFRRFARNRTAMLGLILFLIVVFFAVFAGAFADYDTQAVKQDVYARFAAPGSEGHLLGADAQGRDVFARIIFGARLSLRISSISVLSAALLGTLIGAVVAYYGGVLDTVVMRIVDVFLAVPATLMAVTVVAALGASVNNLIVALAVSMVPPFIRVVRSTVLQLKGADYIEAARAYGTRNNGIIRSHILPNAIGPIIVQTTLNLANVLLSVAALGFIGLGVPSPQPEWGTMLAEAKANMRDYPFLVMIPGAAIALTVLSINLIGDGLRDALDPKLKN